MRNRHREALKRSVMLGHASQTSWPMQTMHDKSQNLPDPDIFTFDIDELLNFDWCFGLQPCTKLTSSACTKLTSSAMLSASSSAVAVFCLDAVPVGVLPVVGSSTSARDAGVAAALVTGEVEQGRGNNDGSANSMPTVTTRSTGAAEEACCGTTTSPATYYYTNRAGGIKVIAKLLTKWQPNLTAEQAADLRRRYADSPVSDLSNAKMSGSARF